MLRRYQDATGIFDLALTLGPETSVIQYYRGRAFAEVRDYQKALDALNRALDLNPENSFIWLAKGEVLFFEKDGAAAVSAFDRARYLTRNPWMLPSIRENPLRSLEMTKKRSMHITFYSASILRILKPRMKKGWHCSG